MWFVYIVECVDETLYTGITTDLDRRLMEHNGEGETKKDNRGAKYTAARRPVKLVYSEKFNNRSQASKREIEIKKLGKKQKEQLVFGEV